MHQQIKELLFQACAATIDGVDYRILYTDEDSVMCEYENGDDTDTIAIPYCQVNLDRDLIYKMTLMNP